MGVGGRGEGVQNAVNNTPCSMEKNVVVHQADWGKKKRAVSPFLGNLGLHSVVPENNHTPPWRVFWFETPPLWKFHFMSHTFL